VPGEMNARMRPDIALRSQAVEEALTPCVLCWNREHADCAQADLLEVYLTVTSPWKFAGSATTKASIP
jgi:hypothetical protein